MPYTVPKVYLILNPVAGHAVPQVIHQVAGRYLNGYEVYETTGEEDLPALIQDIQKQDWDMIVAAGGDGTVSGIVGGLIGTEMPLGVIPVGTGNMLARQLDIPQEVEAAFQLLVREHRLHRIDVMRVDGQVHVLNVGAGLSSRMMRDTDRDLKRRFGLLAYIGVGLVQLFSLRPQRFFIEVDDTQHVLRASEVLVANGSPLGFAALDKKLDIRLDDGELDLFILRNLTLLDYLKLAWDTWRGHRSKDLSLRHLKAERSITLKARHTCPVQADGEIIGRTPVNIQVIPGGVKIIVPPGQDNESK